MASSQSGRKQSQNKKNTRNTKTSGSRRTAASPKRVETPMDSGLKNEVVLIALVAFCILLFLSNFGIIGKMGDVLSRLQFGIFGLVSYVMPILFCFGVFFQISNAGNSIARRKLWAGIVLMLVIMILFDLFTGHIDTSVPFDMKSIYARCSENKNGGGILGGSLAYLLVKLLSLVGTALALFVIGIICIVIITDKSFVTGVKDHGQRFYEYSKEGAKNRKDRNIERRRMREEDRRLRNEEMENEKILRRDRKISGVTIDTTLRESSQTEEVAGLSQPSDEHDIMLTDKSPLELLNEVQLQIERDDSLREIKSDSTYDASVGNTYYEPSDEVADMEEISYEPEPVYEEPVYETESYEQVEEEVYQPTRASSDSIFRSSDSNVRSTSGAVSFSSSSAMDEKAKEATARRKEALLNAKKQYKFPPIRLLNKTGGARGKDSRAYLETTKRKLEDLLASFGVNATVTDYTQGPTVTRFEITLAPGVKVNKIVSLSDDIKLSLAAQDIRIEAPIPGKSAVGIEVPNAENTMVSLGDLLDSDTFKKAGSKLSFAVGKDIGGNVVVTDIAKMPHVLIAGSTGSGKSVCINTLVLSILYKARPDEVQLIMIDPKVVELRIYNDIPHMIMPVVTDPKKAAATLAAAVQEMTDRYKKFADENVRDLKGYNQRLEERRNAGEEVPANMPQIVIIIDELADLMMVASHEVEDSICRLAQLARAAGIHLVVATQRPSVNVITGLIKANMPSRIAFAVSSAIDSRTILDGGGAEKLLGKGDMLFYPQGYTKPARLQGAFVTDDEIYNVVEYIKNQQLGNVYGQDFTEKIEHADKAVTQSDAAAAESQYDKLFVDAGKFIIEKEKASIGNLQRVFKVGFNRAARIMDQLCEAGVVGEEEGTKPRKVLMSMEEFEQLIEEIL